jgi:hypothetical protein
MATQNHLIEEKNVTIYSPFPLESIRLPNLTNMQKMNASVAQHAQLSELVNSLTAIHMRMARVKSTFPNYYQQLQKNYNALLLEAKSTNILPPWMAA